MDGIELIRILTGTGGMLWSMKAQGRDLDFPALVMTINCGTELGKEPDFHLRNVLQIQHIPYNVLQNHKNNFFSAKSTGAPTQNL